MFARNSIKHSSKKGSTNSSFQNMVVDLDKQQEESISGGLVIALVLLVQPADRIKI